MEDKVVYNFENAYKIGQKYIILAYKIVMAQKTWPNIWPTKDLTQHIPYKRLATIFVIQNTSQPKDFTILTNQA